MLAAEWAADRIVKVAPIIRRTPVRAAQHPSPLDRLLDMDEDAAEPTPSESVEAQASANVEDSATNARSPWFKLAFVGLLTALVLLGTSGVGAAAYSLVAGDPYACGGG